MPNGNQVKPWSEIAKNFDPMMPAEVYDNLRLKYFTDFVAPRVPGGKNVEATYAEFKRLTDRPALLSPGGKAVLHSQIALSSAAESALAPLKDLDPTARKAYDAVQKRELEYVKMAEREGMNSRLGQTVGSFAGQAVDFAILGEVLGPLAGGLAGEMVTGARNLELANRVLRGGLAFGTYDALSANEGNRLMSGLKGFGIGASFDLALGMPGFLRSRGLSTSVEDAERTVAEANAGRPKSPQVDQALAEKAKHDAETSRLELRPERPFWQYTLGQRGARVYARDISGQVVPFDIRPGREYDAYRQVRQVVEQGGSVVHYEVHPEDSRALNEFVRIQTQAEESKYRGTVIRTPSGQAEGVAEAAKGEGLPAQALSKDTVEIATVPVEGTVLNKPEASQVVGSVPEAKPTADAVDQLLDKKQGLGNQQKEFIKYHFDKVWNTELDYEDKRSSLAIVGRHAPELLPEQFRAKMPPLDPQGNLVKEVAEARVKTTVERSMGFTPDVESIKPGAQGRVVVTIRNVLTEGQRKTLEEGLGTPYEVRLSSRSRPQVQPAKLLSDAELEQTLSLYNLKPEDVDVEAIRQGGEPELVRQLEIKKVYNYGKPTRPEGAGPKTVAQAALIDKIPLSEQTEYRAVKGGIKAGDRTHSLLQTAIDETGPQKFLGKPAGAKDVPTQLREASLRGRLMGSVEDIKTQEEGNRVFLELRRKGWNVVFLHGYKTGTAEAVYFRPQDTIRVAPLLKDYDQFISQQAGRIFDSSGTPIRDIGDVAHGRLGKAFGVPDDEIADFARERQTGGVRAAPEIARKPYGSRLVLQREDLQRLYAGAAGLAHPNFDEFVKDLGIDVPPSLKGSEPMMILTPESSKNTVYHERLHINGMYAGTHDEFPNLISPGQKQTAMELASGLVVAYPSYGKMAFAGQAEEAFTHAATAVRFGDNAYLEHLASFDRSVPHVLDFVFDTANNLLERTFRRADTVPVRIYQRTLWDLMRRTSPEVSEALRNGARITGSGISQWYDAAKDEWALRDSSAAGGEVRFKDINGMWDYFLNNDKNFAAPSASLRAELGGVRGPVTPIGREPDGASLPVPELPPEGRFVGMSAASALWRPFFPWLATLHENMNALWRRSGKYLPLYETAKGVDDAYRAGDAWLQKSYETVAGLLAPFGGKKMQSVFDYLTYPEAERTSKLMAKYGLSQADAIQAHKVWDFMKEFRDQTHINVMQYMLEFHPKLRGFGWAPERVFGPMTTPQSASYWDKLIRHDMRWDPQDAHIGRFMHVMMREGMEKKFTGKAIGDFEKLIDRKTPEGTYIIPNAVRWPMTNYARYMRGIPDTSQQAINKTMGEFFGRINEKVKALNEHLPANAQLPTMTAPPRQILNRFMLMSYAMGLGLRPAIALRDMMQAFTGGLTVLGPARFTKAFTQFMAHPHDAMELADRAGALLRKNNAGELIGDITQEIPTAGSGWMDRLARWSNTLLAPSRWGHNFGRAIMFSGEYNDALEGIKAYRRGSLTVDQLTENTTLWFMDRPAQSRLLRDISDLHVPAEDAATKVALEAVDLTQWPYRRGTQPTLLRYGVGRIFGQYGVWPANYADFLYRIGKKWTERPHMAARTSATWVAVNYALTHAMEAAGADTSRWFWQSPAGYAGSPHWEFVQSLMVAPENTDEGRAARKRILEYPLNFVPALSEIKSVARAIQDGSGNEWPPDQASLLRALGFRPLDQVQQDQDWEDYVKTQLGYENARRRR